MAIKAATRVSERTERSMFKQPRGGHQVKNVVCKYWLAGRCSRNPCSFLHTELPPPQSKLSRVVSEYKSWRNPNYCSSKSVVSEYKSRLAWRNPNYCSSKNSSVLVSGGTGSGGKIAQPTEQKVSMSEEAAFVGKSTQKTQQKLCRSWVTGNCVHGDNCKNLHSWFFGKGFSMLRKLEGHNKAVTGIALPSGSDKLYSGSKDKSARVWDCHTGECASVMKLDGECGTLITVGSWVFVGLPHAVKAWNIQTQDELTLDGPVGQVYSMVVGNDLLFAGIEDGTIVAWKFSSGTSFPELVASLKGHNRAVLSLFVGANKLYSGSMDHSIRVWDLETLECIQTINGHTNVVMSLLCWDSFLLSGSLDNTIKVWAASENGKMEVVFERDEEYGVLALCGIYDVEGKPILLCSCNDNTVRLYEMPSFTERGRIFSEREVRAIQIGVQGLFFTGDATGQLFVWKLHEDSTAVAS